MITTEEFDQANKFMFAGDFTAAQEIYARILAREPGHPRALHASGVVLFRSGGGSEKAIDLIRKALDIQPCYPDAWVNLGNIYLDSNDPTKASDCFGSALKLQEGHLSALLGLMKAAKITGRLDEAVARCREFISLWQGDPQAFYLQGVVSVETGHPDDAEESFKRCLELTPDYSAASFHLGTIALNRGDSHKATEWFKRSLTTREDSPEVHANLAFLYNDQRRYCEALYHGERATTLFPNYALGWVNYGCALERFIRLTEAEAAYRRALALDPVMQNAYSNLIFLLHYLPGTTPEMIYHECRMFNERLEAGVQELWLWHREMVSPRQADGRLNIGMVSPDFRRHPVGFFILPFLVNHDRGGFHITCYSDISCEDEMTGLLQDAADEWRHVRGMKHDELASLIVQDHIDILIDLTGHTGENRLPLFAMKPAPVQITWAGYVGTTGVTKIDYLISDRYQSPEGAEEYTVEKIIRMPHDYICYSPPSYAPDISDLPALINGYVTFGCFNNLAKVSSEAVSLWAEILRRVEGSRMVLKSPPLGEPEIAGQIITLFKENGISADRITTEGFSPPREMLERYSLVDIQLDTLPYCGGLTTLESLWMGVPVITLPGELFSSRHSFSHLMNVGLAECVAYSREEYVDIASALAGNLERLASLRAGLRDRVASSPVCDGHNFTQDLQKSLKDLWKELGDKSVKDFVNDKGPMKVALEHVAYNEKGNECSDRGDWSGAKTWYEKALLIKPGYSEAFNNLGLICVRMGNGDSALGFFLRAAELAPDFADVHLNLSAFYLNKGLLHDAIYSSQKVITGNPEYAEAYNNLGSAYLNLGRYDDALIASRKALELKPDYSRAHSNILYLLQFIPKMTPQILFKESCRWAELHGHQDRAMTQHRKRKFSNPLRIGFVSPDFRYHPVGYFIQAFMMLYDRERFQVFCYADVWTEDGLTEILRESSAHYKDIRMFSDDDLTRTVIEDGIDILVDLAGHTNGNRLQVFARKPAPVQATWAGYVGTTGLSSIDWLISDRYQSPEGAEEYTSERIIRLPDDYVSYCPPEYAPDVSPLPALENDYITFGSFNKLAKVSNEAISLWSSVLKKVKHSRLFLKNTSFADPAAIELYQKLFEEQGIERDRIIIQGPASNEEMLACYSKVDIQLDTLPYSGGLTTLESLWMGVPVVTLCGELFSSRHSFSHLINAGLTQCIASTPKEYIKIACSLACDPNGLSELRGSLRQRMSESPICDGFRFTENLQQAFLEMWQTWLNETI